MHTTDKAARIAGAAYLLLFTAPLRLVYIPGTLFVRGDATATAANIAAHEWLFRLGIVSDLFTGAMVLFVVLALYRLFKDVGRSLAVLLVILGGLMVAPIYFLNTVNDAAALQLVRGADFLSVFDQAQREALALFFLRLHHHGVLVNQIFWGLWLFPFGALVVRSRFLPAFLGYWLIAGGCGYVAISVTGLLWPQFEQTAFNIAFPAIVSEAAIVLWLLIKGAKVPPSAAAPATAP